VTRQTIQSQTSLIVKNPAVSILMIYKKRSIQQLFIDEDEAGLQNRLIYGHDLIREVPTKILRRVAGGRSVEDKLTDIFESIYKTYEDGGIELTDNSAALYDQLHLQASEHSLNSVDDGEVALQFTTLNIFFSRRKVT
jgi:hypothetical protein